MKKKGIKTEEVFTVKWSTIAIVGLIALTALNFSGDWIFRLQQIELNELVGEGFTLLGEWQAEQDKQLEQLDKDVRSNMKVIDQLTGLLLRGEF